MNREEHIYQLEQYLRGHSICMCPSSSLYWQEHWEEVIKALAQEPITKNDLGVDYRSLEDIKKLVERKADDLDGVMLDASGVIIGLYFAIANDLPSVTPQLSVPEVTALAEWTEKLTKASEDAYNKGYADGMKEQEPRKGHWIEEFNDIEGEVRFTCSSCGKFQLFGTDFCYHCGSDNREVEE